MLVLLIYVVDCLVGGVVKWSMSMSMDAGEKKSDLVVLSVEKPRQLQTLEVAVRARE